MHRYHRAAFIFIANMATADLVMVLVEVTVVILEKRLQRNIEETLLHANEFKLEELTSLDLLIRSHCKAQVVAWCFSISATLMSSIVLTIDRFIYIMYGIKYVCIVTSKWIKIAIAATWLASIFLAITCYFFYEQTDDPECLLNHREETVITFIFSWMIIIMVFVYLANIRICIKAALVSRKNAKRNGIQRVVYNTRKREIGLRYPKKLLITGSPNYTWF